MLSGDWATIEKGVVGRRFRSPFISSGSVSVRADASRGRNASSLCLVRTADGSSVASRADVEECSMGSGRDGRDGSWDLVVQGGIRGRAVIGESGWGPKPTQMKEDKKSKAGQPLP